ncbi:hypothetical protein ABFS82_08G198500 [Erythranthe guttata]|uniref:probable LRR receptor-like serine/threonine-protein kinase At3g47570 n=1 Tax=Erythranthe guttata TaxID=4155 RepID=UPI00064E095C|nr:PREDICTED: probable LRR receptor-like serine/threonine-protein kinase At3g47570 [Erythranthe guttata]|eukprot:XP_012850532.1 PREDICTED: probable LRR receptor-like serine/threonine-protein kinase At3g47570 [Erythranthe guttata]
MEKTSYFNIAYTTIFLAIITSTNSLSLATDQSSLLVLKSQITLDPYGIITTNWTNPSSVCSWIGVTCGAHNNRVTALNISFMNLSGTIPPQLGLLPKLEVLSLRNNSFTGSIPSSLSNLTNLRVLDFSFNFLEGDIPREFGMLQRLQTLSIQYNRLSGNIPSPVFNISTLKAIALSGNELSGNLPSDMCSNLPLLQGIYLSTNKMSGEIPSNLSECSQLQIIAMAYNSFSGQIPKEIGNLKFLRGLFLGGNNLSGVIPAEIGNLPNLVEFAVERNHLTGSIPRTIFNISSLQLLSLYLNELSGSLPKDIGNLTMLKSLELISNNLTGGLPREIGKLRELNKLYLQFNAFTGLIPVELFNMSNLRILGLSDNRFSGGLPTNMNYELPSLEGLYLSVNYLSGEIPHSIVNCSKLRILELGSNNFTGFVPHFLSNLRLLETLNLFGNNLRTEPSSSEMSFVTSLTNCRFLKQLVLDHNPLNSFIPASIGNFSTSLQMFHASNCGIKGSVPLEIGDLSGIVRLSLTDNELSGNIPLSIKNMRKLQGLYLQNNDIGGFIPEGMCDLRSLVELRLSRNKFSGVIPECLGSIASLRSLSLDSNMFSSSIPSSVWGLNDLLELDLSSNSFSGFLPPEIGNLVSATLINLSINQLSESIPSTIGKLISLTNLSLANNFLEGSIPESIGSMISLVSLDMSYNNLSGSIPKSLETLQHLDYLNISFNDLSGEIPTGGPFVNFTMDSFKGNDALCGNERFHVPRCIRNVPKHGSRMKRAHLALFILAGIVAFISVVGLTVIVIIRHKRKDTAIGAIDGILSAAPERISYYELLEATEHFSETNLLGRGGFGSVYKGVLKDGKVLAVKVFDSLSEAVSKSFDVECEVLRTIRHRNLTKVISSCSNKDFKALVLEYMPNGNLDKWLYSHNYCLDLVQRLNIMIDVASALEYLHHGYSTPIVHCDLKPSNVLLDDEMVAHVSDFGIAKLLGEGESVVHTSTLATMGYIAPEYGSEGLVSTMCDIYSYGVMLMETFTRKRPSDDMFVEGLSLKSWVESSIHRSSSDVIDANLLNEQSLKENRHCVTSILELALKCSAESAGDRINMKEALAELRKVKDRLPRIMHEYETPNTLLIVKAE